MEYCDEILHTHWILTRWSPWDCQRTFGIGQGFAEVQILKKKVNINYLTVWNILINFVDNLMLKRSSQRNCKMTFIIGRGFAECKTLKKWKWPYLLNWVKYVDRYLRKHWYWQDLAQEIANWHFLSDKALPSSKFWKSENGSISRTMKNIVMKFCIHIDIDKM